jgi:murein L,D-transpeptidase YafK
MGTVHRWGSFDLIRASLVCARFSRVVVASALLAGSLALAGCYTDDGYQLPTRAMKELSPEMLALLQQKNMPKDSPLLVRIFKEESELEVWKEDTTGRYELLKVYPICRWSGDLGPKKVEGDRQAPEGFYPITPGLMNPNSSYYLAINTGFPNTFDKANGYSGNFLMIHGDCSSRGCYAMTDEQIGEIYSLAREAFLGGQKEFQVQAYPFRMTPANLARHRNNPNIAFWKMLKVGDDHFLVSHMEPKVDVCEKHYVFDAVAPAGSTKALTFDPRGRCPAYEIDPQLAQEAMEKQRNDDYQLADLVSRDVATAPLGSATDGGMNRVFASRLENPTYTYDNEGHLHVPPLQPGRLPPQLSSTDSGSDVTGSSAGGKSFGSMLGSLFTSQSSAGQSQVATADPSAQSASAQASSSQSPSAQSSGAQGSGSHGGFFASLFGSKSDSDQQASAASPPPDTKQASTPNKSKALAHNDSGATNGLRPRLATEPRKNEPQQDADAARAQTSTKPQQEANMAPPSVTSGSLMTGAQPMVQAGSFSSRWGGM